MNDEYDRYDALLREKSLQMTSYNGTMSDDEVVASDVPPRYLLEETSQLSKWVCPSFLSFLHLSVCIEGNRPKPKEYLSFRFFSSVL